MSKFQREVGMIISHEEIPLITILGSPAQVDFPFEYAWELHKERPGIVKTLAHTHPPGMTEMSYEDKTTLKAWAFTFHPYQICMDVICGNSHKRYCYALEMLEEWQKHKDRKRKIEIHNVILTYQPDWVKSIKKYSND